jgi:hypothetical protein
VLRVVDAQLPVDLAARHGALDRRGIGQQIGPIARQLVAEKDRDGPTHLPVEDRELFR